MQDRPNSHEILEGVSNFLQNELVPVLQEPLRFHARVAANLLRIVAREYALEPGHLVLEWTRLTQILGRAESPPTDLNELKDAVRKLNEKLCLRIRNGEADQGPWHREVVSHLQKTIMKKLEVTNPAFLGKMANNKPGSSQK